ncbi:MAG: lateral flagellar basal body rod protein LfgB, partial [Aeromonas veronii]
MSISFDSALGVHPYALDVRAERARILAGNLANVDTP